MIKNIFYASLFAIVACGDRHEERAATSPGPPVKNGNVSIAYTSGGKSDTALVLVHGWCINKEYWKPQVEYFSNRFRVVAPDLGGHGQSGHNRKSWTVEDFAGDVISVIQTLDLKKVILVGHSMGGDIILEVAKKLPDRVIGFVGVDNFKDITPAYSPQVQQSINEFMHNLKTNYREMATAFSRNYLFPPSYADTVSLNRVLNDISNADTAMAIAALESVNNYKEHLSLPALELPMHLIVSDYTPLNEAALKKYCKAGYSVRTIPGTGHYPMIEKPDVFNGLLGQTLNAIAAKR